MHAVLEIAEPSVFVGAVCPCLQLAPIGGIGDVSGSAAVMLPVPQMTPLDRLVSVFVMVVGMMHVGLVDVSPSATQQFLVRFQISRRKYGFVPV